MIVYEARRGEFTEDVISNAIEARILEAFERRLGHRTSRAEIDSSRNSMVHMNNALIGSAIPQTAKHVVFILTGRDQAGRSAAVIVELKQWSKAAATEKDGIVETFVGRARREVEHPSYQAWSYAKYLRDYGEATQTP